MKLVLYQNENLCERGLTNAKAVGDNTYEEDKTRDDHALTHQNTLIVRKCYF